MGIVIKTYKCYVDLLQTKSVTAKFGLQCQQYVNILKSFIRAERTGNWSLHLQSMSNMINLFATTGYINYAICKTTPSKYVAARSRTSLGL